MTICILCIIEPSLSAINVIPLPSILLSQYLQKIASSFHSELREVVNELMDIVDENENFCDKYRQSFQEPKNVDEFNSLRKKWSEQSDTLCSKSLHIVSRLMDVVAKIEAKNL